MFGVTGSHALADEHMKKQKAGAVGGALTITRCMSSSQRQGFPMSPLIPKSLALVFSPVFLISPLSSNLGLQSYLLE